MEFSAGLIFSRNYIEAGFILKRRKSQKQPDADNLVVNNVRWFMVMDTLWLLEILIYCEEMCLAEISLFLITTLTVCFTKTLLLFTFG